MDGSSWHAPLAASFLRFTGASPVHVASPAGLSSRARTDQKYLRDTLKQLKQQGASYNHFDLASGLRRISIMLFEPNVRRKSETGKSYPPCVVIYCAGVGIGGTFGSDAFALARLVLPLHVSVLCVEVDESGTAVDCEPEDLRRTIDFVRSAAGGSHQRVAIWGRSAGANVALRCAATDPTIAALVCDTGFDTSSSLLELPEWVASSIHKIKRLADSVPSVSCGVPEADIVNAAEGVTSGSNRHHCGDVVGACACCDTCPLLKVASQSFVPAFFLHGDADDAVPLAHARALQRHYGGERQLVFVKDGTHHARRPISIIAKTGLFLYRAFRSDDGEQHPEVMAAVDRLISLAGGSPSNTPQPSLVAGDSELRRLLCSGVSPDERRRGLLLAALVVCPVDRANRFMRIPVPPFADMKKTEYCGADSSRHDRLRVVASALLPSPEAEVVIASATEDLRDTKRHTGQVHFVVLSTVVARIIRVAFTEFAVGSDDGNTTSGIGVESDKPTPLPATEREVVTRQVGGRLARVDVLSSAQLQLLADTSQQLDLSVSAEGHIRLLIGSDEIFQCPPPGSCIADSLEIQEQDAQSCGVSLWQAAVRNVAEHSPVLEPRVDVSFAEVRRGKHQWSGELPTGGCKETPRQHVQFVVHASRKSAAQGAVAPPRPLFGQIAESSPTSSAGSGASANMSGFGTLLTSSSIVTHGGPTIVSLAYSDDSSDLPGASRHFSVGSQASGQPFEQFAAAGQLQDAVARSWEQNSIRSDLTTDAVAVSRTLPIGATQSSIGAAREVPLHANSSSLPMELELDDTVATKEVVPFEPPPWASSRHTWPLAEREAITSTFTNSRPVSWAAPGALW